MILQALPGMIRDEKRVDLRVCRLRWRAGAASSCPDINDAVIQPPLRQHTKGMVTGRRSWLAQRLAEALDRIGAGAAKVVPLEADALKAVRRCVCVDRFGWASR
jgi:hypothetical protein